MILFAACLFLLITGAFWYAERNAERLVEEKTRETGQGYVSFILLKQHLLEHFNRHSSKQAREDQAMLEDMDRDLAADDYEWAILVPEGTKTISQNEFYAARAPNRRERRIVEQIRIEFEEQIRSLPVPAKAPNSVLQPIPADENAGAPSVSNAARTVTETTSPPPPSPVSYLDSHKNEYHYYQPVYWTEACIVCHVGYGASGIQTGDEEPHPELRPPLHVVKVTLPSDEAESAKIKSRSILLATAIITVFLSVITLYLVVRYVIVKPLNHLREVSDEISRGNTELRADIQTNDEFEDLAASFNRMVRHLTETQDELYKVNVDLDAKLDQLAQANMQLHEMNRLKSDFLATMSHELRTPLNSIIGFSDVLRGIDTLNDKQKRYVQNIGSSGRMLLEMINEILDLAKMESGKMEVRLTEFSISPVIKAQCDLVRGLSEEKNIDLEIMLESDLPMLYQDQAKVQQILMNLLSNAIKFTPEGGRIVVFARPDQNGHMLLSVEDTGVGIAEEDHSIIFEKFRQGTSSTGADTLTRKFSGTGLGLSIVRELCRLLGGEIDFVSELGKGSTFTARLPLSRSDQANLQSSLSARLDEVTKPQRVEFLRGGADNGEAEDHGVGESSEAQYDSSSVVGGTDVASATDSK